MKRKFKTKHRSKIKIIFILIIIYISFSLTYHTLYNLYIKNMNTEEFINKVINDSKNNPHKVDIFDKYKSPEYLLKLTLNLDISETIEKIPPVSEEVINESNTIDILIFNTHEGEKYNDTRFNNYNIAPDVKLVSNMLEEKLNDKGITTYVERTSITSILKTNNWNYSKSYQASRQLIEPLIKENQYKLILDVHRDSSSIDKTYLEYDGKPYAKVLFVIGTEYTNYDKNLSLATKLNNILKEKVPGISRGIIKKGGSGVNGIYNQDLSEKLLVIEVGGQYNKIEDINNTTELISEAILILLEGE